MKQATNDTSTLPTYKVPQPTGGVTLTDPRSVVMTDPGVTLTDNGEPWCPYRMDFPLRVDLVRVVTATILLAVSLFLAIGAEAGTLSLGGQSGPTSTTFDNQIRAIKDAINAERAAATPPLPALNNGELVVYLFEQHRILEERVNRLKKGTSVAECIVRFNAASATQQNVICNRNAESDGCAATTVCIQ